VFHASINQSLFQKALEDTGWEIKQQLIWKKPAVLSHAHYHWAHEPIFYCSRINSPSNFYGDYQNQTIISEGLDELTREQLIEIIESFKHTTIQEHKKDAANDYIHPTQKPVKMAEYFITNSTQPEEWVLDMFGGSGSTLIACENKNRKCIICELDKKYASHIIERWENKTGKTYQKIQ
jgi:DNA modification methylase